LRTCGKVRLILFGELGEFRLWP